MTDSGPTRSVADARAVVLGVGAFVLAAAAIVAAVGPRHVPVGPGLAPVAGLVGLIAPVVGYRSYLYLGETSRRPLGPRFVAATALGVGVTGAAAVLGVVAFYLSSRLPALIGLVTHVMLTGAIWPSDWRLDAFDRDRT